MKLTDDEIVALAVRDGQVWATPLPTVDLDVPEEVAAAARRGERSLFARDLLRTSTDPLGEVHQDLADLLVPAQHRDVIVSLFTADQNLGWHPGGPNLVCYRTPTASQVLAETVSEGGVHVFGTMSTDDALSACRDLARAAWEGGVRLPAATEPSESLCLARRDGVDVETLQVRRSEAVLHGGDRAARIDLADVEQWLADLV